MPWRILVLLIGVVINIPVFADDDLISRVDVDMFLVSPPEVEYRHSGAMFAKVTSENRWLMVKIEFTVDRKSLPEPKIRKSGSGFRFLQGGFVDDLKLQVRVLLDTGWKVDGKTIFGMYTGETELYTVRRDGKRHVVTMFVPGKFIDRYSVLATGGIRRAAKVDFKGEVIFSAAGRQLARAYCSSSGRKNFEEYCKMVPENMIFTGGVLPRSQTPWALLGADDFDLEKRQ
ncbi:MAG: hypothetical protein E7043_00720 [Lentisphaerae bacterium]|nr:hypothetical protein [Lentisphaerota bacterium]